MNKWEELLIKCGFEEIQYVNSKREVIPGCVHYVSPDKSWGQGSYPPATFENIVRYVVIKVPTLDRPDLLIKWVWRMYVIEVDGDPVNDLIDILYEAMI